ncbi:hypothetical protein V5T82_01670 [Magnetovibrio sp. PR-2]|uniref:hypothetical protein n=1 Tax=Magnetovibrio sp. PR-2 TaxID=3120356 RepID=UPI002FCE2DBC
MTKATDVTFIKPPTTVQDKVLTDDGVRPNFDAAADVIEDLGRDFVRRLPQNIFVIEQDLAKLKEDESSTVLRAVLFRRVHDLKGQAGTYDYWLITVISNELCRFIEHSQVMTPRHFKLMHYHVEAMKMVFTKRMTGKNPDGGQRMINTLHTMAAKVMQD